MTLAEIAQAPLTVLVTAGVLAALTGAFIAFFLVPGAFHWARLRRMLSAINRFDRNQVAVGDFKSVFSKDLPLSHLWNEYKESLHPQHEERDGQLVLKASRSTMPAEMFFSCQAVVDSRLRVEFFKHLPGLFTGIGIIGTFSGLIYGLRAFQVSENAATVRASLEGLMHSVGEAFLISAAAIGLAMLVTFVEKLLLAALYRRTEQIAHAIDARFEAGAGEEYLSRLVKASEESASQSKMLKDALVKELREVLREQTAAQIAASGEQQTNVVDRLIEASREQSEAISASIKQSLEGPLEEIANTVKSASGDQSASAVRMLQDVMTSFSQRLNDLFGGQISGLNDLNQQTARSIQEAVATLQSLVANIEASSQRSTDAMAQRMAEAVEKMESRQDAMNEQSAAFIEQIRQLVASSQSETNEKLRSTLEAIGSQVGELLGSLTSSQREVFDNNRAREEAMANRASSAVSSMTESVDSVIKELGAATSQMAQSVATLSNTTTSSVDKMNAGAELLNTASRNFASAGDRVTNVLTQASGIATKLTETSGGLTSGASALQEGLRDYQRQRDAVSLLVTELKSTVEAARREASFTADVLGRIESSATKLGAAQKQADEYLGGVSEVLGGAHNAFATEVKRTLDRANTEFHTKLTQAVGMLSGAVQELEVTLAAMGNLAPVRA
jgi:DNA anti-recombination protein RmuC